MLPTGAWLRTPCRSRQQASQLPFAACNTQYLRGPSTTAAYSARGARYKAAMKNKDGPSGWQEEHREPPALARQGLQLTSCRGLTPASNKAPRDRSLAPPPPVGRGDNRKGKSEKTHGLKRKQFNHLKETTTTCKEKKKKKMTENGVQAACQGSGA